MKTAELTGRFVASVAAALLTLGALAQTAAAHGVQGRPVTPIPMSAFNYSAAAVVGISFLGLAVGWSRPRFAAVPWRAIPPVASRVVLSAVTVGLGRALVLLLTLFVTAAAAFGATALNTNIAPVSIFVAWWVGLVPVSVVLGDVWRALNPWATVARLMRIPDRTSRGVPSWLGAWPAVALLLVFAWLQLIYPTAASPRLIAGLIAGYSITTLSAMWWFGIEEWLDRGEVFSVYSGTLARVSVVEIRRVGGERRLGLRPPLVGVTATPRKDSHAAFVLAVVGTAIFDGLLASDLWAARETAATQRLIDIGVDPLMAALLVGTIGLAVTVLAVTVAYGFVCRVSELAGGWGDLGHRRGTASAFVHALIPIALAYAVAHYFPLFVFQSQDLIRLASDPLGRGGDLLGTADHQIDFALVSANAIWAVQVGAIVVGHVLGLVFAHDRALELTERPRQALRSQVAVLALMVALTVGGLWSLSAGMATV